MEVYENLTHDRPYQRTLSRNEAVEVLVSEKEKSFDPELVTILIEEVLPRMEEEEVIKKSK